MKQIFMGGMLILVCLITGGCGTESERLANMADRTVEMQSQQNRIIATTNEEAIRLQRQVQDERNELSIGFKSLEKQRQAIHQERRSELAWSESFRFLAIIIATALPLILTAFVIWAATYSTSDPGLANQVLIQELVSPRPRILAAPNLPAIENETAGDNLANATISNTNLDQEGENTNDVTYCSDQD